MKFNKKNIENIFLICIVTVFAGQLYINPVLEWFRFSFAVIVLSLLLLYFKKISPIMVSTIIAFFMFIFRAFVHYMAFFDMTFLNTIIHYSPVATFYIVFGILFVKLKVRKKLNKPLSFIISLWICDSVGNMAEAIFRSFQEYYPFDRAIFFIILIGLIRSIIIYLAYYLSLYYKERYEREQKENRIKELLLFIAKLKTELFFLRKSKIDIENTMQQSYNLYERLEHTSFKEDALVIAKNIHEIKKDYYRVVVGMENTLSENDNMYMNVNEIFSIINDNTSKLIEMNDKKIKLKFSANYNFKTSDFYPLISALNNLIINSIESIENNGEIKVFEERENDFYVFKVIDNGIGIPNEDMDLLFEPGFSTKYDMTTGDMSTGIGLSHVKNIVKNHYDGNIDVFSKEKKGTTFKITIPTENFK
ncbi:MAG: sensor histidine kinase [Firmicutes bacterium]|nr:sensor histidine kinase [Bacillota bacterium]